MSVLLYGATGFTVQHEAPGEARQQHQIGRGEQGSRKGRGGSPLTQQGRGGHATKQTGKGSDNLQPTGLGRSCPMRMEQSTGCRPMAL